MKWVYAVGRRLRYWGWRLYFELWFEGTPNWGLEHVPGPVLDEIMTDTADAGCLSDAWWLHQAAAREWFKRIHRWQK